MMEAIRTNKSALTYTWEGLGHMGGEALYYKCKPTILSEGKLNFFQTSSFGFRNPERHKSNSESTHYPVNQEGACWQWRHRTHKKKLKIVPSTTLNKYKTHRTDINRESESYLHCSNLTENLQSLWQSTIPASLPTLQHCQQGSWYSPEVSEIWNEYRIL